MTTATELLKNLGVKVSKDLEDQVNDALKVKGSKKEKVEPKFVKNPEFDPAGHKLPNQAKMLVAALGDEPMTYADWGVAAADYGMGTRQDPARIAAYYRKTLEDVGAIRRV
jgi:hypothetical protein